MSVDPSNMEEAQHGSSGAPLCRSNREWRSEMLCKREQEVRSYMEKQLVGDSLLDFLLHVDGCNSCRNKVYALQRAKDERFYVQIASMDVRYANQKAS